MSTTGDWPTTLTVSLTAPTFSTALMLATKPAVNRTLSRASPWNPSSSYRTSYTPMGSTVSRYSPSPSVTVVISAIWSAALLIVTVTPGRMPPLSSVTRPTMLPVAEPWATTNDGTNSRRPSTETASNGTPGSRAEHRRPRRCCSGLATDLHALPILSSCTPMFRERLGCSTTIPVPPYCC